jgi:hypothetical protein
MQARIRVAKKRRRSFQNDEQANGRKKEGEVAQ